MNKRKISLLLAGVMIVSAIAVTGCSKSNTASNKENNTQTEQQSSDTKSEKKVYSLKKEGEKDTTVVDLTYENGKPVDVNIDVLTADGSKTELSKEGKYVMKEGEEHPWHEQVELLKNFLKDNNFDISKVAVNTETSKTDAVTGVTIKVNDYVQVVDELMKQVEAGTAQEKAEDTSVAYQIEKKGDKDTTIVQLTYDNGKPVDVNIDVETADGSKTELSKEGKYVMKEGEEHPWHEQIELLEQYLKDNDFDTAKVAVNAETSKTDAVTGVTISVNDYVQLVDELMKEVEAGTAAAIK